MPVKGVVVHWEVAAGGGTITLPATTTSTDGTAAVGWTLGGSVGTNNQELSAWDDGLTGTQVSFTASVITLPRSIYVVSRELAVRRTRHDARRSAGGSRDG